MKTYDFEGNLIEIPDEPIVNSLERTPVLQAIPDQISGIAIAIPAKDGRPRLAFLPIHLFAWTSQFQEALTTMTTMENQIDSLPSLSEVESMIPKINHLATSTDVENVMQTALSAIDIANSSHELALSASEASGVANLQAGNAETSAQQASDNANLAVSGANSANEKADQALSKANSADSNATSAQQVANSANQTASSAQQVANSASQKATTASQEAAFASEAAGTAVSTANAANQAASNAGQTANTASSAANEAKQAANSALSTAQGKVSKVDLGNTVLSETVTLALAAGVTLHTKDVTGAQVGDIFTIVPTAALLTGYMIGVAICTIAGKVQIPIFHPALAINGGYSVTCKVWAHR